MSTTTTNYGLVKPQLTDPADITALNGNWDTLDQVIKQNKDDAKSYTDTKISAIPTPDVSGQINDHNTDTSAHADIRTLAQNAQPAKTAITTSNIGSQTVKHASTAGEADTVDGWHVNTDPLQWGLKPIVATNLDLQANASLTSGYIYLVYE